MRCALAAALACAACAKGPPGTKLASGLSRDVRVSPSGDLIVFLQKAAHPDDRRVPEDLVLGDLHVARAANGGSAQRAGSGVPNLPGAVAFSPSTPSVAFLAAYRFATGEGELWLADGSSAPRNVASNATSFAFGEGGLLALVAGGRLLVFDPSRQNGAQVFGLDDVQTFAWAPGGRILAARAPHGGAVVLADVQAGRSRQVAKASSDFSFGPDGALYVLGPTPAKGGDRALTCIASFVAAPREVGRATSFVAAATGDVALLSTEAAPGEAFGTLLRAARDGEPRRLASRVGDFRFSARGDLVYLAGYDSRSRAGKLVVSTASGVDRELGERVQSFSLAGDRALFIEQRPTKGDFRIELWTAMLGSAEPPRKIDDGVYGYQVAPGGRLFWKARCAGGPRTCALLRGPADASAPGQVVAPNVAGFELSADGTRVLVQEPHAGSARAVDLAVIAADAAPSQTAVPPLVANADPSSCFLDGRGARLVYALLDASHGGVYVADAAPR
jgi:hypothetical protein